MNRNKWLIYTVATGLLPLLIRFFYFLFFRKLEYNFIFNEGDLASFGLILSLSNINELDGNNTVDELWKKKKIGYSTLLIIVFGALYGISILLNGIISETETNANNIKIVLMILCISTLIFSYSIYKRLDIISKTVQ